MNQLTNKQKIISRNYTIKILKLLKNSPKYIIYSLGWYKDLLSYPDVKYTK